MAAHTSTTENSQSVITIVEDEENQPLAPSAQLPSSQTCGPAPDFLEAYECAKINHNWHKVSSSLVIHPEWLTTIPGGRRWTMLHQIVFSGNVSHLNQVLELQKNNSEFRLLCKTLDGKTVRDVAVERAHIYPAMLRRIERLVAVDQLLDNAGNLKWELVRQSVLLQPDIINEKPPYRRFYLVHHLAYSGNLDMYKDLSEICQFKLDLLADNKTISQIAREHNKISFAEYIENLQTISTEHTTGQATSIHTTNQTTSAHSADLETSTHATDEPQYSPSYYDEPSIPVNTNFSAILPLPSLLLSQSEYYSPHSIYNSHNYPVVTHSLLHADNHTMETIPTVPLYGAETDVADNSTMDPKKPIKSKASESKMTDGEQAAYEQTIMSNITKVFHENLLNSITCCITKTILRDPVVAADGFTYEREAILNWFESSNRSPMTNQELDSLELKPNHAIKSILSSLQTFDTSGTNSNKTSDAHDDKK